MRSYGVFTLETHADVHLAICILSRTFSHRVRIQSAKRINFFLITQVFGPVYVSKRINLVCNVHRAGKSLALQQKEPFAQHPYSISVSYLTQGYSISNTFTNLAMSPFFALQPSIRRPKEKENKKSQLQETRVLTILKNL